MSSRHLAYAKIDRVCYSPPDDDNGSLVLGIHQPCVYRIPLNGRGRTDNKSPS